MDMMALAGGLIALVLGIIGIVAWWGYFVKALMAGVPALLILGGALATYLGIEEIRDRKASETFDTGSKDIKDEVESLKEEIKTLKEEKKSAETEVKELKEEKKAPEKEPKESKEQKKDEKKAAEEAEKK
jgi:uncharacterized protein (DUF3084 family)